MPQNRHLFARIGRLSLVVAAVMLLSGCIVYDRPGGYYHGYYGGGYYDGYHHGYDR